MNLQAIVMQDRQLILSPHIVPSQNLAGPLLTDEVHMVIVTLTLCRVVAVPVTRPPVTSVPSIPWCALPMEAGMC